jgi:acetoacetyl-CoA synthetase
MPPFTPRLTLFRAWLSHWHDLDFPDYEALRRWSVEDPAAFWAMVWAWEKVVSPEPHGPVLTEDRMPGAVWFPGARVNYAAQALRHVEAAHPANQPAIVASDEAGRSREVSWPELRRQVTSAMISLREMGVRPGDRVVAVLPNTPQTVAMFLAVAGVGAVWSVCAPEMGRAAVLDRFRQIEPAVLVGTDAVRHGGRVRDMAGPLAALGAELPTVRHTILIESGLGSGGEADITWRDMTRRNRPVHFDWVSFDHPLWIVYSSGTTGLPKAIVHGHGGPMLAGLVNNLHLDVGPSYRENALGERFHWFSSTGWIVWNLQVAGLLSGATIALYDGSPTGPRDAPDPGTLWRFAAEHGVTWLGAGAAFFAGCMKAGADPWDGADLSAVRALGSTGSPLPPAVQEWGSEAFRRRDREVWWCNISGGTDVSATFLNANRELPEAPGRLQCRTLGTAVEAWDDEGRPVTEEVGELVVTRPLPSMPVRLWGDGDGSRLRESYFEPWEGVWRHGDWLQMHEDGSATIHGRSDATINRHGLRLGTAEIYAAVEALDEVADSMVVDLEHLGRESWLGLFVVLRDGATLEEATPRIRSAIREGVSPRFVPDEVLAAPGIPRTLTGKKQEVPIKRLLLGHPPERVVNREVMANPDCLPFYLDLARARASA